MSGGAPRAITTVINNLYRIPVDAAGKPFDPTWHEAVSERETVEVPEGHVVQQLRKGYKLRDRLLRPATVVVAKKPTA